MRQKKIYDNSRADFYDNLTEYRRAWKVKPSGFSWVSFMIIFSRFWPCTLCYFVWQPKGKVKKDVLYSCWDSFSLLIWLMADQDNNWHWKSCLLYSVLWQKKVFPPLLKTPFYINIICYLYDLNWSSRYSWKNYLYFEGDRFRDLRTCPV